MAGEEILTTSLNNLETGILAGVGVFLILFLILISIGIYVYIALAMQSIAKKQGYKRPWFAWIPVLNMVQIFELGGFHWAWTFLIIGTLIPILGFFIGIAILVLAIISYWRIFEKAGYTPALSLLVLVPVAKLIILGIVAWEKKSYPKKVAKKK